MELDLIFTLTLIALFSVYLFVLNKEQFETESATVSEAASEAKSEAKSESVSEEELGHTFNSEIKTESAPCYLVKPIDSVKNTNEVVPENSLMYEYRADFDSEYTNLSSYFESNGNTAPQNVPNKAFYESVTPSDLNSRCTAPVLQSPVY